MSKSADFDKDFRDFCQRNSEMIKFYHNHMKANPTDLNMLGSFHISLQICCDWTDYDDRVKKLSDGVDKNLRDNLPPIISGISATFLFGLSLQQQLGITTYSAQLCIQKSKPRAIDYQLGGERLRIGYLSSGAESFPRLVEKRAQLNPERFEVFYYTFDAGDVEQLQTANPETDQQHTVDLTKCNGPVAAAYRIAADAIQILVNLNESREQDAKLSAILALRPAPIQTVYHVRLGSTGASYVDYFITDKVASPLEFAYGYSETLAYMPNGMFVCSDRDFSIPKPQENLTERGRLRRLFDLPEFAVVFGVKSVSFQMDPDTFECWCEILRKVRGSVLWFLQPSLDESQSNLKKEAKQHRINPRRLIFVDESMKGLMDLVHMDLLLDVVLDTPMFNCEDMLDVITCWVPVVTMPLRTASLLTSVGCEELIATSKSEYVEIAVKLGGNPERLQQMKDRMWENLPNSNLCRVDQYFVDLENLYEKMWDRKEMGEKPDQIV